MNVDPIDLERIIKALHALATTDGPDAGRASSALFALVQPVAPPPAVVVEWLGTLGWSPHGDPVNGWQVMRRAPADGRPVEVWVDAPLRGTAPDYARAVGWMVAEVAQMSDTPVARVFVDLWAYAQNSR